MVVFGQSCCIRAKEALSGQKWLYSEKGGSIRAKVVLFEQKWLFSGKVDAFGQSGSNWAQVVLIKLSDCIRAKWLYLGKSGCIRGKLMYSG